MAVTFRRARKRERRLLGAGEGRAETHVRLQHAVGTQGAPQAPGLACDRIDALRHGGEPEGVLGQRRAHLDLLRPRSLVVGDDLEGRGGEQAEAVAGDGAGLGLRRHDDRHLAHEPLERALGARGAGGGRHDQGQGDGDGGRE